MLNVTIREIRPEDATAAAQLSAEFGYPVVAHETMRQRIHRLGNSQNHVVFVACANESVIAWIDVGIVQHFQGEAYGEIGGFVVTESFRSKGVGRMLIARAEDWMRSRGLTISLVRSQTKREAAHRFYLREGYAQVKTSAVFEKKLPPSI